MADLGSIGTLGCAAKAITDQGPRQALRKIVAADREFCLGGKDTAEGNPSQPSLRLDTFGRYRLRWTVASGTRTFSIGCKQAVNASPRPRVTVLANAGIGVAADVSGSAGSGTGWVTIGPITITPSSGGAVWVVLEALYLGQYAPTYWDHIVTT